MLDTLEKAKILVEALPYIKKFKGSTIVIKFGGSAMVNEELKHQFANDIALLRYVGMNPVVVHGGGKEISNWMSKLGKESVFIDGLRVTDPETMEITEMVLSGKINSELVGAINLAGSKAVGLSGKDSKLFIAEKMPPKDGKDLGLVGEIVETNVGVVTDLTERGYIPVVSSIATDHDAGTLNINADTVASALASALGAKKLIYLTDVDGVMRGDELLSSLNIGDIKQLIHSSHATGGMIPKLENSIKAIENGVKSVHIINGSREHSVLLEIFTDTGIGTMVS